MREIVGADAVIDGKAESISGIRVLGRFRLQIQLTKRVEDLTARLTHSFFCPILAEHARSTRRESTTPQARAPTTSPSGSPTSGSC